MEYLIERIMLGLISLFTGGMVSAPEPPVITPIPVVEKSWKCLDCSPEEQYVLAELQEHTLIRDRNALATIMGNIKQESKFISNICEGGSRVSYLNCHRGGYGIIQWTSIGRYNNLGKFAERFDCDPSTFDCQLRYLVNESIFQRQLPYFQGGGQTISYYMAPAYRWLGWGVKGNREVYAFDYLNKMSYS
mgnify:CR=1 FL=1